MGAQLVRPGSARATALAATATAQAAADTTARLADAVTQARELHARAAQLRAAMDEVGLPGFVLGCFSFVAIAGQRRVQVRMPAVPSLPAVLAVPAPNNAWPPPL